MARPKKEKVENKDLLSSIEAEEVRLQELLDEKQKMRDEYEEMISSEKEELAKFRSDAEFNKRQKILRDEGKLITMAHFIFHYQEEPGGTLQFTKQGIRYELTDGKEYTYIKEIADHINSLKYPDRVLHRSSPDAVATLKVVGYIPRCSATILKTYEKEYDEKTDIPDQKKWRQKAAYVI